MHPALSSCSEEAKEKVKKAREKAREKAKEKAWRHEQLKARINEYTEKTKLQVFVASWNLNARRAGEDLNSWLVPGTPKDVYAIGFQEIVDLNASNLLSVNHEAADEWETKISETLATRDKFVKVSSRHLVGLSLVVFIRQPLMRHVKHIAENAVGVGVMGVGGNKGAVAIRFQLFGSSICFVNSHLAAHQHNVEGRNSDFQKISERLDFPSIQKGGKAMTMADHKMLFWAGDLNYRLDLSDLALCHHKIDQQDWDWLLERDQLRNAKAQGAAFAKFQEPPIDFPPTYKYLPATNEYASQCKDAKKRRMPAWCDRVQWQGEDITYVERSYRHTPLLTSDHKPVSAVFEIAVMAVVEENLAQVNRKLTRELEKAKNAMMPTVVIESWSLSFPDVAYDQPVTKQLRIKNPDRNKKLTFQFIAKGKPRIFRDWLSVTPAFGKIPAGQYIDLQVIVHVARGRGSQRLNEGERLEDILIFHVDNGADYFISVSGHYLKSCFGASVAWLVRMPGPVRHGDLLTQQGRQLSVPKELWLLVDMLCRSGLTETGLFQEANASLQEVELIREALDTGLALEDLRHRVGIHSIAMALIKFLHQLSVPVFPQSLVKHFSAGMNLTSWCKQALVQLPPPNYNVFVYMTSFLREVLARKTQNGVGEATLVVAFCGALMHANPTEQHSNEGICARILRHFLVCDTL